MHIFIKYILYQYEVECICQFHSRTSIILLIYSSHQFSSDISYRASSVRKAHKKMPIRWLVRVARFVLYFDLAGSQ